MQPQRKSALLWGAVGAMGFLVLHQGYLLFGGAFLGVGPVAAVALVVFVASAFASYVLETRFGRFSRVSGQNKGE